MPSSRLLPAGRSPWSCWSRAHSDRPPSWLSLRPRSRSLQRPLRSTLRSSVPARDTGGLAHSATGLPALPRRRGQRKPQGRVASPLRLQLRLLIQQHRLLPQPLPAGLPAGVPEEVRASTPLLLEKHFPVLPWMPDRVRCTPVSHAQRPPSLPRGRPLTQCPERRARTSCPATIFPEIWLMLVLPPKKG